MESRKTVLGSIILYIASVGQLSAQSESPIEINLSGDLVSSYVWRGFKQAGASVQPALSISSRGFTLGAWGSTDIAGKGNKEVDFYASYAISGLTLTVTDYWWDGENAHRYFSSPKNDSDAKYIGHSLETSLAYTLPRSFPLTVAWNTFVLGQGNKKTDGDNSFSTYIELSYPFSIKNIDFKIGTGFTPWKSTMYGTDKFKFTSVQLGASKSVKINDSFSIPVFANIIANPAQEDVHFVFGVTIK